jgi:hypothetical protein
MYPLPESYVASRGLEPTGTVATTAFVASEITLTSSDLSFGTTTAPFPQAYATPPG